MIHDSIQRSKESQAGLIIMIVMMIMIHDNHVADDDRKVDDTDDIDDNQATTQLILWQEKCNPTNSYQTWGSKCLDDDNDDDVDDDVDDVDDDGDDDDNNDDDMECIIEIKVTHIWSWKLMLFKIMSDKLHNRLIRSWLLPISNKRRNKQ